MCWKFFQKYHLIFKYLILLIILILVIWFVVFVFWHDVDLTVKFERTPQGGILITVSKDSLLYPSWKNTVRKVFQAPFDLSYYELCFNNRSRATENGVVEYLDVAIILEDTNEKSVTESPLELKAGSRDCFVLNLDKLIMAKGRLSPYQLKFLPTNVKIDSDPVPEDKAIPAFWDRMASSVIFIISLFGIISLSVSIWELFKKFFNKK